MLRKVKITKEDTQHYQNKCLEHVQRTPSKFPRGKTYFYNEIWNWIAEKKMQGTFYIYIYIYIYIY